MLPRPRLRTILLVVNLIVLGVPVLGFGALQIYDTQLIRRTEAEVIAQAAHLKANAEIELADRFEQAGYNALPDGFGHPGEIAWPDEFYDFHPVHPVLDGSSAQIREPEPAPAPPSGAADPLMVAVGERLEPSMLDAQKTTLSGMAVVDWRGNVVATTNESQRQMAIANREEIERALDGEVVQLLRERENIPEGISFESLSRETSSRVFMAIPLEYDGRIVGAVSVWRTPKSLLQALYDNRTVFFLLLAMMLLGGVTITGLSAFYIGRPIQRLIDQTERVADDETEATEPIAKPGTREVQKLSKSIAEMATSLRDRAQYIRAFAQSVSHEFKTPLTSIRGTVELLEDHIEEMTDDEREEFLEMLDADAERLEQLVGRLLELAEADVAQPGDGASNPVDVAISVAEAHTDDDFEVNVDAPAEPVEVAVDADALDSALTNLVVNACEHGGSTAEITVEKRDDDVAIRVHDDGPGISEGNAQKIFDEFFTTARSEGGTGLGLSITRALVEAHDGRIRYIPTEEGACFEIAVPSTADDARGAE